jgi:hypothetical protein
LWDRSDVVPLFIAFDDDVELALQRKLLAYHFSPLYVLPVGPTLHQRSQARLNEAAAAADASRGLTGQLRCPKTKSAYHVRCRLNTHISNCPAKLKAASFKRPYPQ